jgi:Putative exonuclease SbcCD, C subunit
VTVDGRWANGLLGGAWRKDSAGHIGEGARESARRARIDQLSGQLRDERTAIEAADAALARVADRRRGAELREQHGRAVGARQERQKELDAAVLAAGEFARDVGLSADPADLAEVKVAVGHTGWRSPGCGRRPLHGRQRCGPPKTPRRSWPKATESLAEAIETATEARTAAVRLIALDEAFAGVDDDSRAKCLGLLATFDMDVIMTSEREWGCYPQVPGLAICQLARRDGIDAVLVTPWRWDGRERHKWAQAAV